LITTTRKTTMNLKSIFLGKTTEQSPATKAMALRVSTLAGCDAMAKELQQQAEAQPAGSAASRQLERQLAELQRLQDGLAIEEDRLRVAAVVKRDHEDHTKALKAAEAQLKAGTEAATHAEKKRAERAAIVDQLNQDLLDLRGQAEEAANAAETHLRAVITGEKGEAAEVQAFEALKKAQMYRASCSEPLAARVTSYEGELQRLAAVASEMAGQLRSAQDTMALCRLQLARLEYDQAAQLVVDAYLKFRALPSADSTGQSIRQASLPAPDLTFAARERAVMGSRMCGEHAGLRAFALADLAKALQPANLALLAEPMVTETPQAPEQAPRSPFTYVPGSMQYENAVKAGERLSEGAAQREASLHAGQQASLQA
jgi:hypothetical protein